MDSKKKIFYRVAIFSLISIFTLLSLLYHYVMIPSHSERLIRYLFHKYTQGDITLKVKKASLIYGFELNDLHIKVRNTGKEVLFIKKLHFQTFLPSILTGEILIRKLSVENSRFAMNFHKGRWNWGSIFVPIPKPKQKKAKKPFPNVISLPLPIRIAAWVQLADFSYSMSKDDSSVAKDPFSLQVKNINLNLGLITRTFSEIPLNPSLVYLLDTFFVLANNRSIPIDFSFLKYRTSRKNLKGQLFLHLNLAKEKDKRKHKILSKIYLKAKSQFPSISKKLELGLDSSMSYDFLADRFLIQNFHIRKNQNTLLTLFAALNSIQSDLPSMELSMKGGNIQLKEIGDFLGRFSQKQFMTGTVAISSFSLFGSLRNLKLTAKAAGKELGFLIGKKRQEIKKIDTDIQAWMDLTQLSFIRKLFHIPYQPKKLALKVFRNLSLSRLEVQHEKGYLKASANASPQTGIKAEFSLRNLDLGFFLENKAKGLVNSDLKLSSQKDPQSISYTLRLNTEPVSWSLDHSHSGPLILKIKSQGKVRFQNGLSIQIKQFMIDGNNLQGVNLLHCTSKATVSMLKKKHTYNLKEMFLSVDAEKLYPLMPRQIRVKVAPFRRYLQNRGEKNLHALLPSLKILKTKKEALLTGNGQFQIPSLGLKKLLLKIDIRKSPQLLSFNQFFFTGWEGSLKGYTKGYLKRSRQDGKWLPYLKTGLKLWSKIPVLIQDNMSFQGKIQTSVDIQNRITKGNIEIQDMNMKFKDPNCNKETVPQCGTLWVKNLNLDRMNFKYSKPISFTALKTKANSPNAYLKTVHLPSAYNLRIDHIVSSYNKSIQKEWYYIGFPKGKNGLRAVVRFHNNMLQISQMELSHFNSIRKKKSRKKKFYWEKTGLVFLKDFKLHFADLKPKNMNVSLNAKIQNIDLRPFLPPSRSNYDGIISADLKVKMNSLGKDPIQNANILVSVYQISREFGGFVSGILFPAQVLSLIIRNALEVPSIKIELRDGLIYSYIRLKRAKIIPGIFISSKNKEIKQERMPIAQFLKKAKSQVENLKKKKSNISRSNP